MNRHHLTTAHPRHQLHRSPAPRPSGLRPPRWQRWTLHALVLLLLLSGLAWLLAHFLLRSTGALGEEVSSPVEPWALRLHGMLAYGFMFVFGSMSAAHFVLAWRTRRHRVSGIALIAVSALLAMSALVLYYAPEVAHASASLVHWCIGLGLLPLLWIHVLTARTSKAPAQRKS